MTLPKGLTQMHSRARRRLIPALLALASLFVALLPASVARAATPAGTPTSISVASRTTSSFNLTFTAGTNSTGTLVTVYQSDGVTPVVTIPQYSSNGAITGLAPNTTYMYQLYGIGDGGTYSNSAPSTLASVTTLSANYAGGNATTPTPTVGTITATSAVVNLTYAPATINTIRIYNSTGSTLILSQNVTSQNTTFSGLIPGTTYQVSNQALGDGATYLTAAESAKTTFTTLATQTLSGINNLATSSVTSISVTFTYTAATNASDHTIRIYDSAGTTLLRSQSVGTTSSVTLSEFQPGVTYRATVQPRGEGVAFLDGPESSSISFTTLSLTGVQLAQATSVAQVSGGITHRAVQFTYVAPTNANSAITRLYANDGTTLIQQATQGVSGGSTYSPSFLGLTPNTTYKFSVEFAAAGYSNSTPTSLVSATTLTSTQITGSYAPISVTAATKPTSLSFYFTAQNGAVSYIAKIYDVSTGGSPIQTLPNVLPGNSTNPGFTVSGLAPNTFYYTSITPIGDGTFFSDGAESARTSVVTATTLIPQLATPSTVNILSTATTSTSVVLSTVPAVNGASYYNLLLYAADGSTLLSTYSRVQSGSVITGLSAATKYQLKVQAIGDDVNYLSSLASSATTISTLASSLAPAPTQLLASVPTMGTGSTPTSLAISATLPAGAISNTYRLYASDQITLLQTIVGVTTSTTFTNLIPATNYFVSVTAIGDGVDRITSSESLKSSVTTPATIKITLGKPTVTSPLPNAITVNGVISSGTALSWIAKLYAADNSTLLGTFPGSTSTAITLTALTPNTSYYVRVIALGDGILSATSEESESVAFKTPAYVTLIAPPLTISSNFATSATINFIQPTGASSVTARLYAADGTTLMGTIPGFSSTTLTGLKPSTSYYISLTAIGNGTTYINSTEGMKYQFSTTGAIQLTPPQLTITATYPTTNSVAFGVTYNQTPTPIRYVLKIYSSDCTTLIMQNTNYSSNAVLSGLVPNTQYCAKVFSVGDGTALLTSIESLGYKFTTAASVKLLTPTLNLSSATPTSITYTYTANTLNLATNYTLRLYSESGSLVSVVPNFSTAGTVLGLTPNTLYKATIQAIGNGSTILNGDESLPVSTITTSPVQLAPPTLSVVAVYGYGAQISFTATANSLSTTLKVYSSDCTTLIGVFPGYVNSGLISAPLIPNTSYCATLTAIGNGFNWLESEESAQIRFTTPAQMTLIAPTYRISSATSTSVTAAIESNQNGAIGYLYRVYAADASTLLFMFSSTSTSITVSNLLPSTKYYVSGQVIGNGFTYLTSPEGPKILATTSGVTVLPIPNFTINVLNATTIGLTVSSSNASSFTARIYSSDGATLLSTSSVATSGQTAISGLTPSTTYQVSVVAIGDGASFISSPESAKANVTTLPLTTSTTVTPTLNWVQTINGKGTDYVYDTVSDSAGNIYATGYFNLTSTFGSGAASQTLTSFGAADIFLAKYSSTGVLQWVRQMGGTQSDLANSIAFDKNSNVYITGYFQGAATFGDATNRQTVTSFGGSDGYIAKFGTDGSFQWVKQFGSTSSNTDYAMDVDTDAAGIAYVIGYSYGYTQFGSGTSRIGLDGYGGVSTANLVLAKYLPDGTLSWAQLAGGASGALGHSIAVDSTGNFVITGYFSTNITFGYGSNAKYLLSPTTSSNDSFIAKFNSAGEILWAKPIGGNNNELGYGVGLDGSGNIYVAGYSASNVAGFIDGNNSIGLTNLNPFSVTNDIFIAKYSAEGALTWARIAGGTGGDVANGIAVDPSGNVYVGGYFSGSATFSSPNFSQTLTSVGSNDAFVARYSSRGDLTWAQRLGGTGTDTIRNVALDSSGRLLVAGYYNWDSPALGGVASFNIGAPGVTLVSQGFEDGFVAQVSTTTTNSLTLTAPTPYVSSIKSTALNVTYNLIPGAVSYTLKVYAADGVTLIRTIPLFRSGGTVTGLTVNTNYKFSVTAIGDSVSTFSSSESALVAGATQISSPTPIISLVGLSSFRVSFAPIPGVSIYSLNLYAADGVTRIANYVNVNPMAYTITGLVPGQTYKVSIRPIGDGSSTLQFQESAQVSVVLQSATTVTAPIPGISISTPSSITYNSPNLLILPQMATGALGYLAKIYKNDGTTLIGALTGNANSVNGLMPASTYKMSVTAIGDGTTYLNSPEGTLVTASTWQSSVLSTPKPTILPTQVRAQQALVFPSVYGAISYTARIYGADGTLLNTIPSYTSGTELSWDFLPGTSYFLTVQAIGDGWSFYTSPESAQLSFTRSSAATTTLTAPTPVVGAINANSATVVYQMAENVGNYTLNIYASDGTTLLFRLLGYTSSTLISNLLPNTTYKIGLVANGNGSTNATSAQSPLVSFTTLPATTLIAPIPSVGTITANSFNVTFTAVTGATNYSLRIYSADGTTLLNTIPNFTSNTRISIGLTAGGTYRVGLIAFGDGVAFTDSVMSELVSATLTPVQTLPAPAVENYYPTSTGFKVIYSLPTGAVSATIRVYAADGTTLLSTNPLFSSGTFIVTGLLPSTTYKVSGQSIGDFTNYANSVESEKYAITTSAPVTLPTPLFSAQARDPRIIYSTFALPYGATTASVKVFSADGTRQIAYLPTFVSSSTGISNLLPNTTYRIVMKYRGDSVNFLDSPDSAPVYVTTPQPKQLPAPTPSLTFVPGGGIRINAVGLPALATSIIYYGAKLYASDGTTLLSTMAVPLTGVSMYGFTPGTTYKISMKAFGDGYTYQSSADSALLSFVAPTTGTLISQLSPTPVISAVSRSSAKLVFAGTPSAKAISATIYNATGTVVLQYLPFVMSGQLISNLAAGTTYKIKLTAIGDGVNYATADPSASTTFTTSSLASNLSATPLSSPVITIANQTSNSFQVNFANVLGATSYTFKLYASDGITLLREVTNFQSGTTINTLLVDTNYYVTIKSIGDEINYATSGEGTPLVARTGLTPPTPVISSIVAGSSDASVTITFAGITGAASYQLKRYASDGSTLQATTNNFASGSTITGLGFSTTYKFALIAVGNGTSTFTSSQSGLVSAVTPAQITLAKPVPTVSTTTSSSITVTFPAVTDAISYTAKVYSADGVTLIRTITSFTSGTAITGLTSGLTYKVSVTAIGNGTTILDSLASDLATGITVAQVTLTAPTPSVSASTTTSITITFATVVGAQSYLARMYSAEGSILITDFAITPGTTISSLMPLTSYKLTLKAIGDGGSYLDSAESAKVTIATSALTTLTSPTPVLGSATPNELSFTFVNVPNASSYTARLYTDDGSTLVATTPNFISGGSFIGLNPGTGYRIRLQAIGDGVTYSSSVESPSLLISTVTPVTLSAPIPTITSKTSSSITFTFTAALGALSYKAIVYDTTGKIQIFTENNAIPSGTTITGLTSNTNYKVALSATGDETNFLSSTESVKVSVTTNQAPTALVSPIPALTAAGSNSLSIFYNTVVGATSYTLKIYNQAGTSLLNTITGFAQNGVVTGLSLNTTYKVSLIAIGDGGFNLDGAESSKVAMATAPPVTLSTPTPSTLGVTSNTATITFPLIDGAFDYTAKLYASNGTTLLQTITSFNSGDAITGLSPTTSYRVSITAIGDGISVLDSSESSKVTALTSAPTALSSTPPVVAAVSTDSVTVIFTPITGATSYTLKVYNGAGNTLLSSLPNFNSGDVISSLTPNTTYQLSLTSIGDGVNWNSSTESALVSGITDAARVLPSPVPTVTSRALTSFAITFPAVTGATSYRAVLYSSNGSTVLSTLNNFQSGNVIGGLSPSTQYYVSLTAIGNGTTILTSLESDSVLAVTTTQPSLAAPTPTVSNITTTTFDFTFANITNALSYNAKIYTDQYGSNARTIGSVSSPTHVTGLTPGQTYYLGLESIADGINYLNSAVSSLVPVAIPNLVTLNAPALNVGTITPTSISLSFTPIANASSYMVRLYSDNAGTIISTLAITTSPVTISSLSSDTTYYISIQTIGDGVSYTSSGESTLLIRRTNAITTLVAPTPAATNVTSTSAKAVFTAPAGALSNTLKVYGADGVTVFRTISNYSSGTVVTGLTSAQDYYFTVTSIGDGSGTLTSTESSQTLFTTAAATTLTNPVLTLTGVTYNSFIVTFTADPNATSYTIKLYDSDLTTVLGTFSNFTSGATLANLQASRVYGASVTSIGDGTNYLTATESSISQITTAAVPVAPPAAPSLSVVTPVAPVETKPEVVVAEADKKAEEQNVIDKNKVENEPKKVEEKVTVEKKTEPVTSKVAIQLSGTNEGTALNFAKDPNVLNYTVTVINPATGKVVAVLQNYQPGQSIPGIEPGVNYLISLTKTNVDGKVTTSLPTAIRGSFAPSIKPSIFGLTAGAVSFSYNQVAGAAKYRIFLTNAETGRLVRAVESTKLRVSLAKLSPSTKYSIQVVAYSAKGTQLSRKSGAGQSFTTQQQVIKVKTTIRCQGPTKSIKVTGVTPKCPAGYRFDETSLKLGEILSNTSKR